MEIYGINWTDFGKVTVGIVTAIIIAIPTFVVIFSNMKKRASQELTYTKNFWITHNAIHEAMTELRIKTDCGRAQIIQFHNGGYFTEGVSMQKMTLTHESTNIGVSSEFSGKNDLLLTMFIPLLYEIKKNIGCFRLTAHHEPSHSKQYLQACGCLGYTILPIRNGGTIVGYITCQWCSWDKVDAVNDELVNLQIQETRDRVEVFLGAELKKGKR